jgi:hypothetical protein
MTLKLGGDIGDTIDLEGGFRVTNLSAMVGDTDRHWVREMPMADTELQIATQPASDQKQAVLRQQTVVLGLQRAGGPKLERAAELLESMREELTLREARLERLMADA